MRLVFAGTPAFAARSLEALVAAADLDAVAVYTQPDRRAGRGKKLQASPVKELALAHGLPVEQPPTLKEPKAQATLAGYRPELLVVAAYGLILPQAVLDLPAGGCINVHASLLPRWRGAAPVERAIEAGDRETGITIMQMEAGLDTGPMLLRRAEPIHDDDTGDRLRERLAALGADCLLETLARYRRGELAPEVQDDAQATYAHKLERQEARLDWNADAALLARRVRAFSSANVCFTTVEDLRLKVWQATAEAADGRGEPGEILAAAADGILVRCGQGALRLTRLQLPGGRALPVRDILNGRQAQFAVGRRFHCP